MTNEDTGPFVQLLSYGVPVLPLAQYSTYRRTAVYRDNFVQCSVIQYLACRYELVPVRLLAFFCFGLGFFFYIFLLSNVRY